mgnify:CR=1 FL=1
MSATGISKEIETAGQLEELRQEVRIAAEELLSAANMKPGQILVVGCSSSEIASHKIGSYSSARSEKRCLRSCMQSQVAGTLSGGTVL